MDTFSGRLSLAKSWSFSKNSRSELRRANPTFTDATGSSKTAQENIVPLPPKSYTSTNPSRFTRTKIAIPHSLSHLANGPDTYTFHQTTLEAVESEDKNCSVTSFFAISSKDAHREDGERDQTMEDDSGCWDSEPNRTIHLGNLGSPEKARGGLRNQVYGDFSETNRAGSPARSARRLFGIVSRGEIVVEGKNFDTTGERGRELVAGRPGHGNPLSRSFVPATGEMTPPPTPPTKAPRKLKRSASNICSSTSNGLPPSAFTASSWNYAHTWSASMPHIGLPSPVSTPTKKLLKKRRGSGSAPRFVPSSSMPSDNKRSRLTEDEVDSVDSVKDKVADVATETGIGVGEVASHGGLTLKRSFKLGDGRTLSPNLTLAAATSCTEDPHLSRLVRHTLLENEEWETRVDGRETRVDDGKEKHDTDDAVIRRSKRVNVTFTGAGVGRTDIGQVVRMQEDINEASTSMKNIATPGRKLVGRKDQRYEMEVKQISTPSPTPERRKGRISTTLKSNKVAQPPPTLSIPVLVPSRSGILCNTTTTPTIFTPPSPTATTPSTLSECVGTSTPPSLPGKLLMFFRGSSSFDLGDRSRHGEPSNASRQSLGSPPKTERLFLRRSIRGGIDNSSLSTPRGQSMASSSSSSLRLSAITMGNVKNAFSGVWSGKGSSSPAKSSKGTATTPSAANVRRDFSYGYGGEVVIMEDDTDDGDFRHLRDPFASPSAGRVRRTPSVMRDGMMSVDSSEDGHGSYEDVFVGGRRMDGWGRLPMRRCSYSGPRDMNAGMANLDYASSASSLAGPMNMAATAVMPRRAVTPLSGKPKKYRRERRTRQLGLTGFGGLDSIGHRDTRMISRLDEDVAFDIEEALLAQRLLKRLDDGWEESV